MSQVTTPASKYCRLSKDQTLLELKVDDIRIGLSATAVEYRRLQSGFNEFEAVEKESVWSKIQDQLRNPLILLLLASASISFIMGQMDNAFSIAMAVTIVVTVAFIQEYQSEKSLEALNKLVPHMCRVLRSGHYEVISASLLVPGDIVALDMGNRVPADLRLLDSVDLELDESMLTGENRPSRKDYQWLPSPASSTSLQVIPLAERANIAFMGTLVKQGHGLGVVVGTGASTEFGVVFSMMRESEDVKTPLQIKMDELGKQLSLMSFAVIGVLSVLGLIRGRPMLEVFTIAVSLAVAAIPEGLPIVVTVTLALGVLRLTRKNVIVKKLPSVESLSAVDVICLDKTGTLTLNRLTVNKIYFAANKSTRDFLHETLDDTNDSYILRVSLVISGICNNARLIEQEFVGNAVDAALLGFIKTWRNRQIDSDKSEFVDVLRNCTKRIEDIPFNSDKKYMAIRASLHTEPEHDKLIMTLKNMSTNGTITSSAASKSGYGLYFVKGAPEYILSMCKTFVSMGREVKPLTSSDISFHLQQASMLSSSGLRTLALAYGTSLDDLVFCSILGMRDPPRPEISGTIRKFQACGIRPLMITGDSKETAVSIAHSVGIIKTIYRSEQGSSSGKNTDIKMTDFDTRNILSGSELENMTESDLCTRIESLAVLYRATPSHKVKVIQQLQRNGHVVAMSGDGVNDGPSLKIADVGISMGVGGTDVSKEAAKIILINDDLGSLISGIEEGKSIFHNIRGFIRFQLSTSLAALALVSISNLFGLPNPMNAMQILYINLIMDGAPAQSLGLEPVDSDVMSKPPRLKNKPILDWPLLRLIIVSAVCISIGTLSVFWQEMAFDGKVTARDRTMTFTTFVFFDMFNALACRSEHKSIFTLAPNRPLFISIAVSLVGQMMAIYVPFISNIFQTEPLSLHDITRVLIISSIVLWIDEIRKRWPFGTRETVETRGGSTSNAPLLPFSVNNGYSHWTYVSKK